MSPYAGAGVETCGDFRRGVCTRGEHCRFAHVSADGSAGGGYGSQGSRSWNGRDYERNYGTWPSYEEENRAAWNASQAAGHPAAADASAETHRVLELQSLLPQGQLQHLQPGAAAMQAAVPAHLPQATMAHDMETMGRIAAAAAGGQAGGANNLALLQQIYQMVAHSALAPAAGHQSYPAVQQPGPAAHLPALTTTAVLPAALPSPATLQPPSSVALLPVTQPPPALAAAQCDAASTPLAAQPALAAILPAATSPAAAAQLPAAQPPGLGSVLPASRHDPWTEVDPWIRPSGQQPQPALQPAAQPFASPPDLAATTAASYVAQPAAAAEPPDPGERAYPGASRAPPPAAPEPTRWPARPTSSAFYAATGSRCSVS